MTVQINPHPIDGSIGRMVAIDQATGEPVSTGRLVLSDDGNAVSYVADDEPDPLVPR